MTGQAPAKTKIWQYSKATGGLENHLVLNEVPTPNPKSKEHLIRVIAVSLNPVDFKPAEAPIGGLLVRKPATPGYDVAGEIVVPAPGSAFKPGQLVFGGTGRSPFAGGALSEYITAPTNQILAIPEGVSVAQAAALPIAALTAYQTIKPNTKPGDKILLNGGSGGVGHFGIQIAKALGCHVTVTCSSKNVDFCKSLGADEVVDYTKGDVVESLKALGYPFDLVIDNVGSNHDMYWKCDQYTKPKAKWINIASSPSAADISFMAKGLLLPSFLGGQSRKFEGFYAQPVEKDLQQIVDWAKEGKIKVHIDTTFPFSDVAGAFRKLKTGRTRGKLIIDLASQVTQ